MALGRLFSALPVRQGDAADQIEVYVFALEDTTQQALETVISQAIRGQHPKFSRKFAPTCAELGEAIFEEMERVKRRAELEQEKLRIADHRPAALPTLKVQDRIDAAKARMQAEGRRFLLSCESYAAAKSMSSKVPVGSVYVGILCAWYGPVGSINQQEPQTISDDEMQEILRADMFEPDPEPDPPAPEPEYQDVEF